MAKVMEVLGYGEAQSKDAYIQHITELYNLKIEPKETFGEHLNRFKENFKDDEKKAAVDSFISDQTDEVLKMVVYDAYEIDSSKYFDDTVYHNINIFNLR